MVGQQVRCGSRGSLQLAGGWQAGLPDDFETWLQVRIAEAGVPAGFAASNGVLAITP